MSDNGLLTPPSSPSPPSSPTPRASPVPPDPNAPPPSPVPTTSASATNPQVSGVILPTQSSATPGGSGSGSASGSDSQFPIRATSLNGQSTLLSRLSTMPPWSWSNPRITPRSTLPAASASSSSSTATTPVMTSPTTQPNPPVIPETLLGNWPVLSTTDMSPSGPPILRPVSTMPLTIQEYQPESSSLAPSSRPVSPAEDALVALSTELLSISSPPPADFSNPRATNSPPLQDPERPLFTIGTTPITRTISVIRSPDVPPTSIESPRCPLLTATTETPPGNDQPATSSSVIPQAPLPDSTTPEGLPRPATPVPPNWELPFDQIRALLEKYQ